MLMAHEYLDELKELIRDEPDITFSEAEMTRDDILADNDVMEDLWIAYQKGIQDYDMGSVESYRSAMNDVLHILVNGPAACVLPNSPKRCPKCGWPTFHVNAHVVQTWEVNGDGTFVSSVAECVEVTHQPDDDDIWTCANCGHSAAGREFNVTDGNQQA